KRSASATTTAKRRRQAVPGAFFRPVFPLTMQQARPDGARRPADDSEDGIMTATTSFKGSFTALVTPFRNGSVDEKAFRELVDWQIAEGTNGLVPVGTTGESPTLTHHEHGQVVEWCVEQAKGRVPVIAGAGSNSTAEAVSL